MHIAHQRGQNKLARLTTVLAASAALLAAQTHTPGTKPPILTPSGMVVTPANATALATALLGSGVTLSGTPTLQGAAAQAATFTNAPAIVGFPSGIILSSGNAADAAGNYAGANLPNTDEGGAGNAQLNALISSTTFDASVLSFSFIPTANSISFSYIFASAEYPNYVGSFNDVFGFFVNGVNYALLPGTSTVVSINNVNTTTNSAFFNKYNVSGDLLPYGGETKVLTVTAPVNIGVANTMVLGVADALDHVLDSAIFLQAGSLTTTVPLTPAPPALLLLLTGLAALGMWFLGRRFARRTV